MNVMRKRLGDLLIETGIITELQLETALKEKSSRQRLGDILVEKGFITEQQLIEVLEFQLGIPHISLYHYPFDTTLFSIISKETAKRNLIIPLKKEEDKLFVAMADPMDFYTIEDLRLATGFRIETAIAAKDEIIRSINKYYDMDDGFIDLERKNSQVELIEEEDLTDQDSPIVKLVNQIFTNAFVQRASDIHIDPQETKVVIRYRVDGLLKTERLLPKHMQNMLIARIKIMANLDITEYRIPQDGRIKRNLDQRHVDLRVSTLPTVFGEKIVLRIMDLSNTINSINQLGFNSLNLQRFMRMIEKPHGIILISGPTGSGKSSTLYAALNHLNTEEVNIITIEDPVEYQVEGINQIQINPNVGLTFATGLRSVLRQDPNIIMVGEIRDKETVDIAIRASLTGHLVFSTIHTNDSLSTVTRLLDMGVEPFLVANSISGIVAQRLVRKICRDCIVEYEPTKREIEIFQKNKIDIKKVYRGHGCSSCNMTGYRGRVAVHEVLAINDEMRKLMMNDEPFSKLQDLSVQNETIFLLGDGLMKVKEGITTTEEVLRIVTME
ncbi:Flp pilus assembly complex ATPase component TadA [Bacillus sp. FJAT-49732]|uniref:Flp pilus assembly complex ATPase component TadA n=1 Tax=Lederbergia citrisecunda TaxID=2833583 RepID=A0A942TLY1_9BACI|nr:ATPase, T2SS/T4P/T4SS family [Lederbergia citrisecunda]MBS4199823.1 Flp pilus assembly complex ATPase component TadA [Lederbergia citrisecunda]